MLEVKVFSGAHGDVAAGKSAEQSSTYKEKPQFRASKALDGNMRSFSHTGRSDTCEWWEVDLEGSYDISKVEIYNRYCPNDDESDPKKCLCRMSFATVSLIGATGKWVDAVVMGNTCGVLKWEHSFVPSVEFCGE